VIRLNFLISAICVAEPASGGDYPVIKHSVPKIRVAIERNKYQNGDRWFWGVFGYTGKSPTCGGGELSERQRPVTVAFPRTGCAGI